MSIFSKECHFDFPITAVFTASGVFATLITYFAFTKGDTAYDKQNCYNEKTYFPTSF